VRTVPALIPVAQRDAPEIRGRGFDHHWRVAMPSSYVIGRDGKIVARHMGFKVKQQDEYESIIVDALRRPENENE
jgi:peroxiredoxin